MVSVTIEVFCHVLMVDLVVSGYLERSLET